MNDFDTQKNTLGQNIRLTKEEKDKGLKKLLNYMEAYPSRPAVVQSYFSYFNAYEIRRTFSAVTWKPAVALCAVVFLFTSVSVSYAAEGALPGDTLYTVKVGVNEEVKSALSIGKESKATWEVRRAERRLEEAEALVVKGKITPEVEVKLASDFTAHIENASKRIEVLRTEAPEAAIALDTSFDATLHAHGDILESLERIETENTKGKTARLRSAIATKIAAEKVKGESSIIATSTSAADIRIQERLKRDALSANSDAREAFSKVRSRISENQAFQIDEELRDAKAQIEAGEETGKEQNVSPEVTLSKYKKSYAKSRKLSVFLKSNVALSMPDLIGTSTTSKEKDEEKWLKMHDEVEKEESVSKPVLPTQGGVEVEDTEKDDDEIRLDVRGTLEGTIELKRD